MSHLDLAQTADVVVVAPASADFLARTAHGLAGDVLGAVVLATRAPLVIAPAMNTNMWTHPATRENVKILSSRGVKWAGPAEGRLACGAEGPGRLAPTEEILKQTKVALKKGK